MNVKSKLSQLEKEAEKLVKKLDDDNERNQREPLNPSHSFIGLMKRQLAKVLVHRTLLISRPGGAPPLKQMERVDDETG